MDGVIEIKAYQLADGTIIANKEEAISKAKENKLIYRITRLIEENVPYSSKQDIVRDAILDNLDDFKEIFRNYLE